MNRLRTRKKLMSTIDLTIVLPAYREELRIESTLDDLSVLLDTNFFKNKGIEILVVVANSSDKTQEIVLSKKKDFQNLHLLKPGNKVGKGRDVQYGMLRAKGNVILFMDADLATPLAHIEEFYKEYEKGYDVVIATRDLTKHHSNTPRLVISQIGNILFRLASGVWVEDSQCGFKLFSRKASNICFQRLKIMGWGFDMEILAIAKVHKLKIKTIRIDDWISVEGGSFDENIIKNSFTAFQDLLVIWGRRITKKYLK